MNELRYEVAGVLGQGLVAALFATLRVRWSGVEHLRQFRDKGEPVIFVLWHSQLLPLTYYHRNQGVVALVSEHGDGEYITRLIRRIGFGAVRGSSTRGAAKGLKGLIRAARAGHDLAVTPDGPRGPARVFKPGALAVAQMTGLPLLPVAAGASSAWRLRSWDGFLVPRPLATLRIEYAPPRWVPRDAGRTDLEGLGRDIQEELNALSVRVGAESPA
jgi:hypothetical protein